MCTQNHFENQNEEKFASNILEVEKTIYFKLRGHIFDFICEVLRLKLENLDEDERWQQSDQGKKDMMATVSKMKKKLIAMNRSSNSSKSKLEVQVESFVKQFILVKNVLSFEESIMSQSQDEKTQEKLQNLTKMSSELFKSIKDNFNFQEEDSMSEGDKANETENKIFEDTIQGYIDKISKLNEKISQLNKKVEKNELNLEKKDLVIKNIKSEKDSLKASLEDYEKVKNQKNEIEKKLPQIESLEQICSELKKQNENLEKDIKRVEKERDRAQEFFEMAKKEEAKLRNSSLNFNPADIDCKSCAHLKRQIESLRSGNPNNELKQESWKIDKIAMEDKIKTLEENLEDYQDEKQDLEETIKTLENDKENILKKKMREIALFEEEVKDLENRLDRQKQEKKDLKKELRNLKKELRKFNQTSSSLITSGMSQYSTPINDGEQSNHLENSQEFRFDQEKFTEVEVSSLKFTVFVRNENLNDFNSFTEQTESSNLLNNKNNGGSLDCTENMFSSAITNCEDEEESFEVSYGHEKNIFSDEDIHNSSKGQSSNLESNSGDNGPKIDNMQKKEIANVVNTDTVSSDKLNQNTFKKCQKCEGLLAELKQLKENNAELNKNLEDSQSKIQELKDKLANTNPNPNQNIHANSNYQRSDDYYENIQLKKANEELKEENITLKVQFQESEKKNTDNMKAINKMQMEFEASLYQSKEDHTKEIEEKKEELKELQKKLKKEQLDMNNLNNDLYNGKRDLEEYKKKVEGYREKYIKWKTKYLKQKKKLNKVIKGKLGIEIDSDFSM